MLKLLRIKDFAIIEDQTLEFEAGLNVISGETGSGKSLVLEAFRLVLGERASTDYFRKDTAGWQIEAVIDLSGLPKAVIDRLPDIANESDELVITRQMSLNGRGRVFINGRVGTLALLQEIAPHVIALCTQGQQMQLTDSSYLLFLLDEFGGLEERVAELRSLVVEERRLRSRVHHIQQEREKRVMRQAELEFVIGELEALAPREGLRGELELEIHNIKRAQAGMASREKILELLLGESGILSQLSSCHRELRSISSTLQPEGAQESGKESGIEQWAGFVARAEEELTSLERSLRRDRSDASHGTRLEELQEQLSELARLERKFRTNDKGLAVLYEQALNERDVHGGENEERELLEKIELLAQQIQDRAVIISEKRRKVARELKKLLQKELQDVGMKGAQFQIEFQTVSPIAETGLESVEFFFCPNVGEESKPLRQIASGGELSRVMLVLKKLFRDRTGVSILVFDEVDSGISGAVAQAVGMKLQEIGRFSQVICITHLPQVAAYADRHFAIEKVSGDRTRTIIRALQSDDQVEEIARMLAGYKITAAARASARELLSSKDS